MVDEEVLVLTCIAAGTGTCRNRHTDKNSIGATAVEHRHWYWQCEIPEVGKEYTWGLGDLKEN